MTDQQPIIWVTLRELADDALRAVREGEGRAREAVLEPNVEDGDHPGMPYVIGFRRAYAKLAYLEPKLAALADIVAGALTLPARPLEAVLADIEAEGHEYTIDSNYGNGDKVRIASKLRGARFDHVGEWDEAEYARHRAWEQEAEVADTWRAGSVAEVTEAHLTAIRELHAEKAAHEARMQWVVEPLGRLAGPEEVDSEHAAHEPAQNFLPVAPTIHIEAGQVGPYVVGFDIRDGQAFPWVVVREDEPSVALSAHETEDQACTVAGGLNANGGAPAPEAAIARELRRREADASEETTR